MGAPVGNKFWKIRSKHGRERIFNNADTMLQAAYEYFEWNSNNTWFKSEAIKSGDMAGTIMKVPTERPLTIEGLTQFWGVNKRYLEDFEKGLKVDDKDFSAVITHIREVIYRHKFEGASVGAFNATIMSRELGLVDKKDMTTDGESMNKGFSDFLRSVNTISDD